MLPNAGEKISSGFGGALSFSSFPGTHFISASNILYCMQIKGSRVTTFEVASWTFTLRVFDVLVCTDLNLKKKISAVQKVKDKAKKEG